MAGFFSWLKGNGKQQDVNDYQDDKFKVGQIWNYDTRPDEDQSTIEILKIERYEDEGIIIHIHVKSLKVKNKLRPNGISEVIGHLPLSKEAVSRSITTLISENNKLTEYKSGYNNWKEAFDQKKAGIFTNSIKETIDYVEEAMINAEKVSE